MGLTVRSRGRIVIKPERALDALSRAAIDAIRRRCQAGLSLRGRNFARYSPGYARTRARHGKRVSPPDLHFSGAMLGGLYEQGRGVETNRAVVAIGIRGQHAHVAAYIHYGTRYMPARPFMGLTREEHRKLVASRAFDKVLVLIP